MSPPQPDPGPDAGDDAMHLSMAAMLSNRLDPVQREELVAVLAESPEARELLQMAYELYRENSRNRQRVERTRVNGTREPLEPSAHAGDGSTGR